MRDPNLGIVSGFLLDLVQLRYLLAAISLGDRIWSCPASLPEDSSWLRIRYSNPLYGRTLPNEIIYQFPIIRSPICCFSEERTTYVCLSLAVAEEVQSGLYFEDAEVKGDFLEDLDAFWVPIHSQLQRHFNLAPSPSVFFKGEEGPGE